MLGASRRRYVLTNVGGRRLLDVARHQLRFGMASMAWFGDEGPPTITDYRVENDREYSVMLSSERQRRSLGQYKPRRWHREGGRHPRSVLGRVRVYGPQPPVLFGVEGRQERRRQSQRDPALNRTVQALVRFDLEPAENHRGDRQAGHGIPTGGIDKRDMGYSPRRAGQ